MRLGNVAASLIVAAALAGCGRSAVLQAGAVTAEPAPDEAIIVVGVRPADYRIMFFPGSEKDGTFTQNPFMGAAISGMPTDGYVVAKAKVGEVLGLTIIQRAIEGTMRTASYGPCGGSRALVVRVPRSRVVYLGDIEYTPGGSRVGIHYDQDVAAAERFLKARFPQFAGTLGRVEGRALAVNKSCNPDTIPVPVYIGGKK